ncbi:MAG: hypothetical protein OEU92_32065 [Alphaproteobacteria bacterium]|nr:hypothetical protein [Alphaproteobacteria bacterium]
MPIKRSLLAALTTLAFTATSSGLALPMARSALLIEGNFAGETLRIVVDTSVDKADVTVGNDRHWIDLSAGEAHRVEADGTISAEALAADEQSPAPEIKPWGPGPTVAGHATVYHVMTLGDQICGELLVSTWMKPFVDPAVRALAILERIKGESEIKKTGLDGACGDLPFSSYALAGWPLMVGGIDQPIFKTEMISFDYEPNGDELSWSN